MVILWLIELYKHLDDYDFHNIYQIYYQTAKISRDWNHFMILEVVPDLK